MSTPFDTESEHPNRSEKLPVTRRESLLMAGRDCLCGNCKRLIDLRDALSRCPSEACGTVWGQILIEKDQDYIPEDVHLPVMSVDVVPAPKNQVSVNASVASKVLDLTVGHPKYL